MKKKNKKNSVWIGEIPGIFGCGITCVGNSKEECMNMLKQGYADMKKHMPNHKTKFETSFEYFGGIVTKVEFGKWYYNGFSK